MKHLVCLIIFIFLICSIVYAHGAAKQISTMHNKKAVELSQKAYTLYNAREYLKAEFIYSEALNYDNHYDPALYGLGCTYYSLGKMKTALEIFRHVVSHSQEDKYVKNSKDYINRIKLLWLIKSIAWIALSVFGGIIAIRREDINNVFCVLLFAFAFIHCWKLYNLLY